jgi:hypothetical protein
MRPLQNADIPKRLRISRNSIYLSSHATLFLQATIPANPQKRMFALHGKNTIELSGTLAGFFPK